MEFLMNPSGFPKVIQNLSEHLSTRELKSLSVVSSDWSHAVNELLEERAYFNLKCTESAKSINRTYRKFLLFKVNRMYIKKAMKWLVAYNTIQCNQKKEYQCEELFLHKLKLTENGLKLLKHLGRLKSLRIEDCCVPNDLDDMTFNLHLEHLSITSDDTINKELISRILSSNKDSLKTISLMIPFTDFSDIFEKSTFPNLQKLSLLSNTVSSDALETFFNNHKSLQNFTMMSAVTINDTTLESLSRNCTNLEALDLRLPLNTTDKSVDYINRFKELKTLTINGMPLEGTELSHIRLPKLTHFGYSILRNTSNSITDKDLESLFLSMSLLRTLNLGHCENQETRITSKTLSLISKCFPELESLQLNGNCFLCEGQIEEINVFKHLFSLNLFNTRLKDKFLCAIKAPNLKKIDLGLSDITITSLMHIVDNFKNLESIEIISCKSISDSTIKVLLNEMKFLKFIDARECPLTLDGFKYIMKCSFVNAKLSYDGSIEKLLKVCGETGFIFISKCK